MALTRKMLKAMGIDDDKIDQIIEAHSETVDALKEQRDQYKADAEKLPGVQNQLDSANAKIADGNKDSWRVKYDAVKEEFEAYKTSQNEKEMRFAKENAYRDLLRAAGVSEKRIPAVLRVSDIDSVELADGKIKDSDAIVESIKSEWADFIPVTTEIGADISNPPENNATKKDPFEIGFDGE